MAKNNFKEFAKLLCLAQVASDGGKGINSALPNGYKAWEAGYAKKDTYIHLAISYAKKLPGVKVSKSEDMWMTVIYFDIQGFGQVSFHSPRLKGKGLPPGEWKGSRKPIWGHDSREVCAKLDKKFNLRIISDKVSW